MDGLRDTEEPRNAVSTENWEEFLSEFVKRNKDRRARFDVYKENGEIEEEGQEAHLENIVLKSDGEARNIEVVRTDLGDADAEKITVSITNVRGIRVQYDTDGSEDVLEFIDDQNTLISLRFESNVDGVS